MTLKEIAGMPTCVDKIPPGSTGVHESCLKAYQILNYAKGLLVKGTPPDVVLKLIQELEEL